MKIIITCGNIHKSYLSLEQNDFTIDFHFENNFIQKRELSNETYNTVYDKLLKEISEHKLYYNEKITDIIIIFHSWTYYDYEFYKKVSQLSIPIKTYIVAEMGIEE